MGADNYFSMICVKLHAGDVRVKHVFQDSHRLACSRVPHLYRSFTSDVDFESDWRELRTGNGMVIGVFLHKRLVVLEDFELATTADQSTMLWYGADARHLIHIGYIEGLDAAVVKNAPHFNHTFRIRGYKTV
jgi:hypothetical protein